MVREDDVWQTRSTGRHLRISLPHSYYPMKEFLMNFIEGFNQIPRLDQKLISKS